MEQIRSDILNSQPEGLKKVAQHKCGNFIAQLKESRRKQDVIFDKRVQILDWHGIIRYKVFKALPYFRGTRR
jgi:hypothetical protein